MRKKMPSLILLIALFPLFIIARTPGTRILFIPLDDRPPCLQFTQKIGLIGDAILIIPPKELLGRFTTPGQSDKIISWINSQDLQTFKSAIVSVDMLVYGGLVASRVNELESAVALQRMRIIEEINKKAPGLPLYAQNVIMRLAPTADGKNGAYRADLANWAEVSVKKDEQSKKETALLESRIPAAALKGYRDARVRNLAVNQKAIDYVRSGTIRYLILSQDDARLEGVHVADRVRLVDEIKRLNLSARVAVQPGADEVSMLLLARALNDGYHLQPRIKPVYSSDLAASTVMPFEDKPLEETVAFHIRATGSQLEQDENQADLLFYVFASRREAGRALTFATEIEAQLKKGKRVIVADIDPVGDVQGGDSLFTHELARRGLFPELNGYASWNTAANTIGTTLPQGIVFYLAQKKLLRNKTIADSIWTAQNWFTFHRVLDDYYFHGLERLRINRHLAQEKLSSSILDDSLNKRLEAYAFGLMQSRFLELAGYYRHKMSGSIQTHVKCMQPNNLSFRLPWNRTFEAEIDFRMVCVTK